jgi:HprK-related kinase A
MNAALHGALPALTTTGVQLRIGPFLVRVRSELPGVRYYLSVLYPDFPVQVADHGHFDVVVVRTRGVRRWVRRQANLSINGLTPFLPLPESLAGPAVEWGLNWCFGTSAHRRVAVHSSVVERAGRAMIMPAPPGSGKSTLCAALVSAGWRLFSDEFAIIDPDAVRILPVPRPLSLKEASIEIIRSRNPTAIFGPEARDIEEKRFVHMRPPAESVARASEPALPGWVVLPRYERGKATSLEPLPKAEALIQLTDQSFNYNFLGAKGYTCLVDLIRQSACYRLVYSDLDDVIDRLTRLTDDPPGPQGPGLRY